MSLIYAYDPYGVRTTAYSSSGFTVDPSYTGHTFHKDSGLHLALYETGKS